MGLIPNHWAVPLSPFHQLSKVGTFHERGDAGGVVDSVFAEEDEAVSLAYTNESVVMKREQKALRRRVDLLVME